jgi:hypothetical protein
MLVEHSVCHKDDTSIDNSNPRIVITRSSKAKEKIIYTAIELIVIEIEIDGMMSRIQLKIFFSSTTDDRRSQTNKMGQKKHDGIMRTETDRAVVNWLGETLTVVVTVNCN